MNHHLTPLPHLNGADRRPRVRRTLDLYATLPDHRTAAAMDDAAAARDLVDDLLSLVDAGLVVPVEDDGEIRYAPAEPDDLSA